MPDKTLESRMSYLEGAFEKAAQRLNSIDSRLDGIDRRIDGLDRKVDALGDRLDRKIDQRFMWTIGVVLSTWLSTMLAIFLHH